MKQTNKQRSKITKEVQAPVAQDKVFEVDYLIGKVLYYFFFIFLLTFIIIYI